jgi:Domain of unknown function (DUF4124)
MLLPRRDPVRHLPTSNCLRRGAVLAALLALACPGRPLSAQEVYKSVDAQGHVVYSDRGATKNAEKTAVHVEQPDPAEVARLAKQQEMLKAEDQVRAKQEAVDAKNKAADAHKKEVACTNARNYYFRLVDARRLYKPTDNGDRVFLSDEDADALRQKAKQAMNDACGT